MLGGITWAIGYALVDMLGGITWAIGYALVDMLGGITWAIGYALVDMLHYIKQRLFCTHFNMFKIGSVLTNKQQYI